MTDFTKIIEDDIAIIKWDCKEKSMNTMSIEGMKTFGGLVIDALENKSIKGIIITSGKKDFSGGMDLSTLESLKHNSGENPAAGIFDFIMQGHQLLRKIELGKINKDDSPKPVVWAVSGVSAGIGTEIGLACHRRIVSSSSYTRIGLPEILVGLFPGLGGTTRVPRMIGLMGASSVLLEGKLFPADKARTIGIVDEVVAPEELLNNAKNWILNSKASDLIKPWDQKAFKFPGGAPYHPSGFMSFVGASALVNGKTKGLYFAAKALLSTVYEGALVNFDSALKIEARWFTKVLMTETCTNMTRTLFLNKEKLEKGMVRPTNVEKSNLQEIAIIGSGMMGSGIAYVSAISGMDVILIDRDKTTAEKGKEFIAKLLEDGVKKRRLTENNSQEVLSRITASSNFEDLVNSDLIIEAVFEDLNLKKDLYKEIEPHLKPSAVLASNTSTLPITELAESLRDVERFIGIHFFSPVEKMNLVEIIKGKRSGDKCLAVALDFTRKIKKTPIVVNDARGFFANRCIIPYINEGLQMVSEGIKPSLIENCAKHIGMPLGPLQLIDELSLNLAVSVANETKDALGTDYKETGATSILMEMFNKKRFGRKNKGGFYDYDEKGKRLNLWDGLANLNIGNCTEVVPQEVKDRLAYIQALEAVRAYEEKILLNIEEGDVGAILGWGCLIWAGGPFSWLDMSGHEKVSEDCSKLEKKFGVRFKVPNIIKKLASEKASFYREKVS